MAKNVLLGSSNICLCFLGSRQFLTGPLFVECRKLGSLPWQGAAVGVTQLFLKKKVKEPSREDSENLGWNTDDKKKEKK